MLLWRAARLPRDEPSWRMLWRKGRVWMWLVEETRMSCSLHVSHGEVAIKQPTAKGGARCSFSAGEYRCLRSPWREVGRPSSV